MRRTPLNNVCVCLAENRNVLHEQNVERVLVALLSVADVTVKTPACRAVAAMSCQLSSKDRFRELGKYTRTYLINMQIKVISK